MRALARVKRQIRLTQGAMCLQGRCSTEPPEGWPLKGHKPGQCVLLTKAWLWLTVESNEASTMWVDNIHFRGARTDLAKPDPEFYGMVNCPGEPHKLWMTNCTFQGDGAQARGFGCEKGCRSYLSGVVPDFDSGAGGLQHVWFVSAKLQLHAVLFAAHPACTHDST